MTKYGWHPGNVSAQDIPQLVHRTVLEVKQLRDFLLLCPGKSLIEFGAGFGRLFHAYSRYQTVAALEREPVLVDAARRVSFNFPYSIDVQKVDKLWHLPSGMAGTFDVAVSYTVLQHLRDKDAARTLMAMIESLAPGGFIVLAENTSPGDYGRVWDKDYNLETWGRSVKQYREMLPGFELVHIERRVRASESKRYHSRAGHLMLFGRGSLC